MANSVCEVSITESPLSFPLRGRDVASGAVVDFSGVVRGLEGETEISGIEYEAHRAMAEHQLRRIAEEAISKHGLSRVLIHHRIGFVPAGEASVIVRVESSRRLAAFSANQAIMEELKRLLPIWKRPIFKEKPAGNLSPASARA